MSTLKSKIFAKKHPLLYFASMADRSQQTQPKQGTLSKEVERLTNSIINELSNLDNIGIDDYLLMLLIQTYLKMYQYCHFQLIYQ